jgi:quercetin dioxygenase-like cupin family protein
MEELGEHYLGAEVEFWLSGEKHTVTKTCAVLCPAGVPHCPLLAHQLDRPFIFITTEPALTYEEHGRDEAQ